MATGRIVKLDKIQLEALVALEQAAFLPVDQQSRRSLRYLLGKANADVWGQFKAQKLASAAVVLYRRGSRVARLYSIATDRTLRQKGLAKILLSHCEKMAVDRGCRVMRAEVRENNTASQRLFLEGGYRQTGNKRAYYPDGMDAFLFEKHLPGEP